MVSFILEVVCKVVVLVDDLVGDLYVLLEYWVYFILVLMVCVVE